MPLKKAGANWVDGDRFYNRSAELEMLIERARDGTHTLLTAPRRMGKTSLVRELLRRLAKDGNFETIFVDLEDASDPADALAEIGAQSRSVNSAWYRIRSNLSNTLKELGDQVDTISVSELRVQLRAGIAAGNRWRKGDDIFAALAESDRPVVLAIDELPIFVNRLLRNHGDRIIPEGKQAADEFLSWLRKNGQTHRGRITMILSGSVGLEPILRWAGLSAQINIFTPCDLKPWSEDTALSCLDELAKTYSLNLPLEVRKTMCHRLRSHVPHHIQQFFDHLHEHLRRENRTQASLDDVERVYNDEMLSVRGQVDLEHYESRLRMALGTEEYRTALELLTETAISDGLLSDSSIEQYRHYLAATAHPDNPPVVIENVLYLLEHDGYLGREPGGYRFTLGLLEDWWRARHGQHFTPIKHRRVETKIEPAP